MSLANDWHLAAAAAVGADEAGDGEVAEENEHRDGGKVVLARGSGGVEVGAVRPQRRGGGENEERKEDAGDLEPEDTRELGDGSPDGFAEAARSELDAGLGGADLLGGLGDGLGCRLDGSARGGGLWLRWSRRGRIGVGCGGGVGCFEQRAGGFAGADAECPAEANAVHGDSVRATRMVHPMAGWMVDVHGKRMRIGPMKNLLYLLGGVGIAVAYVLFSRRREPAPVEELAHRLQDAWADHHTVA